MARIFFAWELGGEFGHAFACATLARALHAKGHEIALMFREDRALAALPETSAYDHFAAPRFAREGEIGIVPASVPDILLGCGYAKPEDLGPLLDGWLVRMRDWRPDLVVCDFAPTALLAARMLGLARVTYGNGFFTPPRLDPLPAFRFDAPVPAKRLRESNDRALATVNAVLAQRGAAPLARFAQQFEADEDFLCTFPELDHYPSRPTSGYWGPRFRFDRGREARWPKGRGKRIFVYMKRTHPLLDAFIAHLARGPHRTIAYIPDLDEARRARLATAACVVADRPVRLDGLMKECDLVVCHGGEMSGGALMSGIPQLLTPTQYEQFLTAKRMEYLGGAGWIGPQARAAEVPRAIERMTTDPTFTERARAYARRYPAFSPEEQRRRIVRRIEEILAAGGGDSLPHADADPILSRSPAPGAQG